MVAGALWSAVAERSGDTALRGRGASPLTRFAASCRSHDATRLATALLLQAATEEPLKICSLDDAMRRPASDLGFAVLPVRVANG